MSDSNQSQLRFYVLLSLELLILLNMANPNTAKSATADICPKIEGSIWCKWVRTEGPRSGNIVSSNIPAPRALTATVKRYTIAVRPPKAFQIVVKVAALVAGPVIRNTSAAPGVRPLNINAAVTGIEAVAQT